MLMTVTIPMTEKANNQRVEGKQKSFDVQEQSLELLGGAQKTTENLIDYMNFQLLGNADQLQKSLSTGNLSQDQINMLVDSLIKGPLRRYAGMLRSLHQTIYDTRDKVQHLKPRTP